MEEKYKIHAFYILFILGSIIVGLISVKWAEIPALVAYITFALTVSSLGLALLAIIYSMYSNTTFSHNISTLESSTKTLTSTSTQLALATDELKTKVENIPGIIETVSDKVTETHALLSDLNNRSTPAEPIPTSEIVKVIESKDIPISVLSRFLEFSSFNGLLTLYIFSLSHKTKTPFISEDVFEIAELDKDYSFGFMVAASAAGLFSYDVKKEIWTISAINEYISENISSAIDDKIKDLAKDIHDESGKFETHRVTKKKELENYFNE